MSVDETRVLIGGRKLRKIPPKSKLFVESEDPHHGSVRHRRVLTSTPNHPPHNKYWTPPKLLKPQLHQNYHHDSGFYGSFYTPDSSHYSDSSSSSTPQKSTIWHSFTSPIRSIKKRLACGGRQTFLDDERSGSLKVQPQQILGCIIFVTIITSLGFTILLSIKHFGLDQAGSSEPVNGKYQSMKFANEKMNVKEASDHDLSNIIVTEEHGAKIKASGEVDDTSVDSSDSISEELLPTRQLVVEHPAPTKAPSARNVAKYEASDKSDKSAETMIDTLRLVRDSDDQKDFLEISVESLSDALAEPECCPHKPTAKESFDSAEKIQEASPPTNNSKFRKKSRSVNPLTKSLKVVKMSKAKLVEKVTTILRDIKSLDYPDLPTFRGLRTDDSETDAEPEKKDDVDYPEDPYYSGIIRSRL